jgi:hypothetical protein
MRKFGKGMFPYNMLGNLRVPNFSHINTGGFDYDIACVEASQNERTWLATHHDMIVGLGDYTTWILPETDYNALKNINPDLIFVQYIPYNTMLPAMVTWMENWCTSNSRDPELLYYHYYYDTTVRLRNGATKTVLGYGGGTAETLSESRAVSSWWAGIYPNVCPTSQTFRDAFNAYAAAVVTVNASANKYCDGVFLDTFQGTVDDYYIMYLQNTIEMIALGKTNRASAEIQASADLVTALKYLKQYLTSYAGKTMMVIPNAGDISYTYHWMPSVFHDALTTSPPIYTEMGVEYLIASGFNSYERIQYLKKTYDDMDAGFTFFINSQTNFATGVPFGFIQFILASHYLINHTNGYFSYHRGNANTYAAFTEDGLHPYSVDYPSASHQYSHWHKNIEYDIGSPVVRSENDYWGSSGTDRFFVFASEGTAYNSTKVLGRKYENALVLAKFGSVGGWDNIGINPITYALNGNYQRLLADNTLGDVITEITLGYGEGAILIGEENSYAFSVAWQNTATNSWQNTTTNSWSSHAWE